MGGKEKCNPGVSGKENSDLNSILGTEHQSHHIDPQNSATAKVPIGELTTNTRGEATRAHVTLHLRSLKEMLPEFCAKLLELSLPCPRNQSNCPLTHVRTPVRLL